MFQGLAEAAGWRRPQPEVKEGRVYCRTGAGNAYEWATVLSLHKDHRGIPHVTYQVLVGWGETAALTSQRTLTLSSFAERYAINKHHH